MRIDDWGGYYTYLGRLCMHTALISLFEITNGKACVFSTGLLTGLRFYSHVRDIRVWAMQQTWWSAARRFSRACLL